MKQRITISLDEDQAAKFDQLIAERGYENRSEAPIRLPARPAWP